MMPRRGAIGKIVIALVAVVIILATAIGFISLTQQTGFVTATNSTSSTTFIINDLLLQLPQSQTPCQGLLCTSDALLSGTILVDANSPMSCLDVYVNGTSEGSYCLNVTSPSFTIRQCSGSGNQSSCSDVISPNPNTQTSRTFPFNKEILGGSNNVPIIVAGKSYLISLVAHFQDGSSSTISATVVASVSSNFSVATTTASATSTRMASGG